MKYIEKIEEMGGMIAAIEKGYPQREIADAAYRFQKAIDEGKRTLVGVNKYVTDHPPVPILKIDPEVERKQIERLSEVRRKRDNKKVKERLEELRHAAEKDYNLMPYIIECVREYATIQEICDVFREVYGVYRDPGWI